MVIKGDEIYNLEDLPIEEQFEARESLRELLENSERRKCDGKEGKINVFGRDVC